MPFSVRAQDGVLMLELDTPGSAINIFNRATAEQLLEILAGVRPSNTRAIVFSTGKPNSFINGVGLLLAHASRTREDILRSAELPWAAYRAVHEAPVPTIAAIRGNCFGCGVEFALNCDYRIASDSAETQFYMTELNDYLFIPLFGSTWNLPEAVGLQSAIELLLDGQRWTAETARDRGLIDVVARDEEISRATDDFVRRILDGEVVSGSRRRTVWGPQEERALELGRNKVANLPPVYHQVYGDALALLEGGARRKGGYLEHQRRELDRSAASALSDIGKAAYSFFYLRQMAAERAAGRARGVIDEPTVLALTPELSDSAFAGDLLRRKVAGIRVIQGLEGDLRLNAADERSAPGSVAVRLGFASTVAGPAEIYAPAYRSSLRLLELATGDGAPEEETLARLVRSLQRFGFEIARTRPHGTFLSNRLLFAYLRPLLRYLDGAEAPARIAAELRTMGFVRRTDAVLHGCDLGAMARSLAPPLDWPVERVEAGLVLLAQPVEPAAAGDPVVGEALCLSMLEVMLEARATRTVRDASIVDLIARELLDFPRHHCSLGAWLKIARVRQALDAGAAVSRLVGDDTIQAGREMVAAGKEIYR